MEISIQDGLLLSLRVKFRLKNVHFTVAHLMQKIVKVDSCFLTCRYLIACLSRLTEIPEDVVRVNVNDPSREPQTRPCQTKITYEFCV